MTTGGCCRMWVGLAVLLAVLAAVEASTLTVWDGPGCTGDVQVLSCGSCHKITKQGGYYYLYTTGSAVFYSSSDCSDSNPANVLEEDEWHCNSFTYNSVYISCSSSSNTASWDITAQQQQQQ